MSFNPKNARNLVLALGLGAVAGAAVLESHHEEQAKSEAEREDPDGCEELADIVWDLLHEWESGPCEREDDYVDDLAAFLKGGLSDTDSFNNDGERIKIERRAKTHVGVPDILIDDRLVLELKLKSHEGEKDRLIGQCCKYSVEWVTWAVVLGMKKRKVRELTELLAKKSLHYIEVIDFDLEEVEDDEED